MALELWAKETEVAILNKLKLLHPEEAVVAAVPVEMELMEQLALGELVALEPQLPFAGIPNILLAVVVAVGSQRLGPVVRAAAALVEMLLPVRREPPIQGAVVVAEEELRRALLKRAAPAAAALSSFGIISSEPYS